MYKDINMYLKADLCLRDKKPNGAIDGFLTKAYHAVTKKSILRNMDRIKSYQYTRVNDSGNVVPENRSARKTSQLRVKENALSVCQFMLDNFEKRMRAVNAMHSRNTVKRHADKYKYMGKLKGKKRALREPKWLTEKDRLLINAIYKEAKALRKGGLNVHVDHIIPLCGDKISGLHVPENLEIVPALDNLLKNNTWRI